MALVTERRLYFDADAINYLTTEYTIKRLRSELLICEMNLRNADDSAIGTFYADYKLALELAIEVRRFIDAPLRRKQDPNSPVPIIDLPTIKANSDIFAVAERYTTLRKAGKYFTGLCPFHSEKHGSFFVYPEQQTWHCFGACNTGGDVISLVMKAEHIDFKAACYELQRS